MSNFKKIGLVFSFFLFAQGAQAFDPFAEVYVGTKYFFLSKEIQEHRSDFPLSSQVGIRAGTQFLGVLFGGIDMCFSPAPNAMEHSGTVGIIGGISAPLLPLRGWLGVNLPSGSKGKFSSKLGISLSILPILSINLESYFNHASELRKMCKGSLAMSLSLKTFW